MGSCSSVQKGNKSSMVASPKKKNILVGENNAIKVVDSNFSLKNSEFGSKTEVFFDSQAWLDSDCDDDFFSVNGDFTPSQGTTPNNNPIITLSRGRSDKSFTFDTKSEISPTGRKKLSILFQETPGLNAPNENLQTNGIDQESSNLTMSNQSHDIVDSVSSTPSRDFKKKKIGKKAAECCLPSFRQKMSPVPCNA